MDCVAGAKAMPLLALSKKKEAGEGPKPKRPCKGKRERAEVFKKQIRQRLLEDPGMDFNTVELPNFLALNQPLRAQVFAQLEEVRLQLLAPRSGHTAAALETPKKAAPQGNASPPAARKALPHGTARSEPSPLRALPTPQPPASALELRWSPGSAGRDKPQEAPSALAAALLWPLAAVGHEKPQEAFWAGVPTPLRASLAPPQRLPVRKEVAAHVGLAQSPLPPPPGLVDAPAPAQSQMGIAANARSFPMDEPARLPIPAWHPHEPAWLPTPSWAPKGHDPATPPSP